MTAAEISAPDESLQRAIRPAVIMAWALSAGLPATLAVEEFVRSRFHPFLGFAPIGDRLAVRYGFFLAAAASVIVIRLLNAFGLRRKKSGSSEAVLKRLKAVALWTLAFAEAPALLGFALFLAGGFNVDFYGLMFVSLVLLFMYFPRTRTWEERLRNAPPACPF